jgi:outer membrane immunogenic protein
MTRPVFAAVAAGLFAVSALVSGPASAADQTMSWQGAYVGANFGYQWSRVRGTPANPSGVAGGVQLGHNWQFGQYVFGGEADIQLSDADDKFAAWKFSNPWFGTLRGRAGVTMSNLLLYGTLGLAYGSLKAEIIGPGVTESHLVAGWTGGVGVEAVLMGNWSARAEYLYVDLGDRTFVLCGAQQSLNSNILRVGVNYHF